MNRTGSMSLNSHDEQNCEDQDGNTPGARRTTVTDCRVTLYPYKTKKHRR